jgi:pantetheine-phosphate adenylyltransferase
MRIAVCPGSFDPITNGHLDIIKRASKLFDKVIVVVMVNFHKPNSYFTASERVELIERSIPEEVKNCEVDMYGGLLAEYCKKKGACAIVKGLRAVSDFEYEFQQALTNKHLNPELETIFMTTDQNNMFLSSSLVKQVCEFGGDVTEFLPAAVSEDIIKRIKERSPNI